MTETSSRSWEADARAFYGDDVAAADEFDGAFRYEAHTVESYEHRTKPIAVEAYATSSDVLCTHRNYTVDYDTGVITYDERHWCCSHMPSGVALWTQAPTERHASVFASALAQQMPPEDLFDLTFEVMTEPAFYEITLIARRVAMAIDNPKGTT